MELHTINRGALYILVALLTVIFVNVARQYLPRRKSEPPLVFHWLPIIGNAIEYGTDPFNFYKRCRAKHGNIFTFVLLGKKMTVCLGPEGNEFVLNGRVSDVNAEDIYGPLTTPVFGSDVIYDCPNAKLMEQKKFVKFGLTQQALESYVPLIEGEVLNYLTSSKCFQNTSGKVNISAVMAEITLFTAGRALQGAEVRKKLTAQFAELYHDLDMGFQPINFLIPWAPLPQNRRRDAAHLKMRSVYMDLINDRRRRSTHNKFGGIYVDEEPDMISNLMSCVYRSGQPVPDKEIANMMITMLMGGQHSSSSASAWIMLRLASQPSIAEELYDEQRQNLGSDATTRPLSLSDLDKLPLLANVIKETLRVHSSIHSIMRKVMRPIVVPGTDYVITPDKVLVSSPIVSHMSPEHFADPERWDPHRWDHHVEVADADDVVDYGYGVTSKGTKSPYLPFGAGRHRCIGEKFAYLNLATIVVTIVRNMKLRTPDGSDKVPPTDYSSLFSRPVQSSEILWERRRSESST
ncbi:cytochrome P450 [Xylaria bambusicola]|uniref:cytochrome P450 n=1 Tax=Xylaria bambusicola TaxID=326684 RepID=UPI0020084135|nr:cytochrome P450 [Xylaria bambusicola]KAI0503104.1 cytochrome P450 [Xylaria bambusicola]